MKLKKNLTFSRPTSEPQGGTATDKEEEEEQDGKKGGGDGQRHRALVLLYLRDCRVKVKVEVRGGRRKEATVCW